MLSPVDIQHHLYLSFLDGQTADVALKVNGTWHAVYKLHRVVLIQSGYFKSLFTAGFAESSPRLNGHHRGPDELEIVLDDRNITRAAFEVCIAHLYGGGPPLELPTFLVPTATNPLSPSFPTTSKPSIQASTPEGNHPVTPRFLLSLLATSLFLSIPSLASDALSMILNSVGPWTAVGYLRFATGKGIGWNGEWGEWDSEDKEAAVGLERVATLLEDQDDKVADSTTKADLLDVESDLSNRMAESHIGDGGESISPSSSSSSLGSSIGKHGMHAAPEPSFYYGAISDKIGQAVACWLARWGGDMFAYEIKKDTKHAALSPADRLFTRSMAHLRQRAMTIPDTRPSTSLGSPASPATRRSEKIEEPLVPAVWGSGGLDARWVSALLSADTLFVRGERERYDLAAAIVELRRRQQGILPEEESIWSGLFERGIYYSNMSVDDITQISQDISPITKKPYVPLRILQAAHWDQAILRQKILASASASPNGGTTTSKDKDLCVSATTSEILSKSVEQQEDLITDVRYYPVHADSSMRLGDTGGLSKDGKDEPITMEQLYAFASGETNTMIASPSGNGHRSVPLSPTRTSESTFFGLHAYSQKETPQCPVSFPLAASQLPQLDATGNLRWTPYPPYRFSVEFWDIDWLKEKSRLHSHTIWYCGSLFNVYVQVVWKKGGGSASSNGTMQVGVYLHRQSSVEAIPGCSRPSAGKPVDEREGRHVRGPSMPALSTSVSRTSHYSPSIHPPSRSATPVSVTQNVPSAPSSPVLSASPHGSFGFTGSSSQIAGHPYPSTSGLALPVTLQPGAPSQPYRDPRSCVKAYFTICCASGTGTAQTRFSSAPDEFAVSQSWGWKSSSLTLRVGAGAQADGQANASVAGEEVSLRATVVLGIV
ncbi:hypothetical protein EYR36_006943 [Pleurotus pulmonarius]|nr:hypothetical protein EYR36_006943 [Pleurotus pulmonarius]